MPYFNWYFSAVEDIGSPQIPYKEGVTEQLITGTGVFRVYVLGGGCVPAKPMKLLTCAVDWAVVQCGPRLVGCVEA